jgi:hypothetical protein
LVSGKKPQEPDVAYDLRLFEIPQSQKIDLEPVIERLKGMMLLQKEKKLALKVPKSDNQEEEEKASASSVFARIDLKERVNETLREQSEFIRGLQKAKRVFRSPEDVQNSLVDELNKISQRHQVKDLVSLIVGNRRIISVLCSGCGDKTLI